jgi:signal transduction histidine kinase
MILDNLISNAIKFTQTGSIVVRVTHQRDQQCVQFEVEDTGPGIEPGHLETIFEPFHQLERSSDNPFGGFGLGLAIVHRHVGLLGGTIAVRSTVDVGTCFTLTLPYRPGATRARDVGPGPAATAVSAATESPLSVEPRAASAQPR